MNIMPVMGAGGGGAKNEFFWPFGAIFGPFWPEIKNFFIFLEKNKKKIMKKQDFHEKVAQI